MAVRLSLPARRVQKGFGPGAGGAEHPATQRQLATLKGDGVSFAGPDEGAMACGEFGFGRMAEPAAIFNAIMGLLEGPAARPLAGRHVLVTAGPTAEALDPVRGITNVSSGKMGYALARACAQAGAEVVLVSGPVSLPVPADVKRTSVTSALEMRDAVFAALQWQGAPPRPGRPAGLQRQPVPWVGIGHAARQRATNRMGGRGLAPNNNAKSLS